MTKYFNKFPLIYYPDGNHHKVATDILRRMAFTKQTKNNENGFIEYTVKDGEKPENIAANFYGSPHLFWIIFLANDILNPFTDWPLSSNDLEKYVVTKYGTEGANDVNHYRLVSDGTIVDVDDPLLLEEGEPLLLEGSLLDGEWLLIFDAPDVSEPIAGITNRQYEIELNEAKRFIKLLRPEFVNQAISELKQKIE